jgi:protein SCO1/2
MRQRANDARSFSPSAVLAVSLLLASAFPTAWAEHSHHGDMPGMSSKTPSTGVKSEFRGGLVTPPLAKPSFTLTDTSGKPFDLRAETEGSVTLLFFGYTHCPDMCPTEMAMLGAALRQVPVTTAQQFKVVFVTTDPERDSPAVLRKWLDYFNHGFIGLTGSVEATTRAQVAANLPPAKKSAVRADGGYEVGHASFVLAYTRDNLAHVIYPIGLQLEDWVHDLPLLAASAPQK